MSVWFCIPSARPPGEAEKCLRKWRERGYKIALWVDQGREVPACDFWMSGAKYPGYAMAVNELVRTVIDTEIGEWFVTGGDDTDPDPNRTAEEIAAQCSLEFGLRNPEVSARGTLRPKSTYGVMQPTGDRFAFSKHPYPGFPNGSAPIDRVAGSPWLGRDWCLRINQGNGPLWSEYTHMFADEELQNVAIKHGVFWQRPDLIHSHHHFQRESDAIDSKAIGAPPPAHLIEVNSTEHWLKYKKLFEQRRAAGFPGSEPL
jgi:hypothetical protein